MSLRLNPRHRILTVICGSLTALIAFLYWQQWFFGRAEQAGCDWLMTNSTARLSPANPRIVFLAIDEDSRSLGALFADDFEKSPALQLMKKGFPWNREVYAQIIERLSAAGAKAIVFDLIFPGEREGDEAFRAALEKHSNRVVIGTHFVTKDVSDAPGIPSQVLPTPNLRPPEGGPSWLGFVNVYADPDGLVRRISFRTTFLEYMGFPPDGKEEEIFSLAARALEKAGFSRRLPEGHGSRMFRYSETFPSHSLHEIFVDAQWNAPPYHAGTFFHDKIVLIGVTGQASEDRLQTPFGVKIGPDVHLSAINAALNRDFLSEASRPVNLALIIGGGLIAWMLGAWMRRPVIRLVLLAVTALAYQQTAQYLANEAGLILIILSPLLTLISCGITWAAWEQVLDRVERQRTRRALERYVGHDVAGEVLDNPASYVTSLGGKRKDITVFFSDIRGFTSLTETVDPQALVAQLNEYLEQMVAIVFANQGTIDKFIGDAVMAHWGSIVSAGPATDAARAVTTALQMRQAMPRLNARWKERGTPQLQIGMGINQGDAIVGNIGASGTYEKMDFTVIGDAVNLGSRLEGVTKQYHLDLCIGENVAHLVRDQFVLRSVDLIVVKGKTRPVEVFTVLAKRPATEPPWLARHEEAVRHYRAGEFAAAESAWRDVLAQAPHDGLAPVFLERCAELITNPPATPWTGAYEMKSK
jgi:adenylate cyclase